MSYRQLDNIDEKIILATLKVGSSKGTNHLPTKDIAKECDVSEFVIYDHFDTKAGLVSAVEKYVVKKLDEDNEKTVFEEKADFPTFLAKTLEFYLKNPEYTGWTLSYGHIFPRAVAPEDNQEFYANLNKLGEKYLNKMGFHFEGKDIYAYYWSWVYRHIVNYAGSVNNGTIVDNEENRKNVVKVMAKGLDAFKALSQEKQN
jgi:hypothetical protein